MATLVFLGGYLVYIVSMMALWFLLLVPVIPSLMDKPSWISIPIAFTFPLALKNFPWVVLISGSSIASQVIAILLCLACYLVCTLIGLVVLKACLFICRAGLGKHRDEAFIIIGCVIFMVMDIFMSYSIKLVNDMQGITALVERPSFTSQLLASLPFSIKATLLDPTGYLVGMLATLLALWVLSFLVAKGLSLLAAQLPLDTYPRLRFAAIVGVTFMVMRYMVDNSAQIFGIKATLLGLARSINDYRVAYLVLRYVTFLALALLPLATSEYNKAAVIILLGVVLTMQPGPSKPIEKPTLIYKSPFAPAASTMVLDDFMRFSEEMMVEHKMATEKIVSEFNLLITESTREIQSFIVHAVLVLMTPICAMLFYVWNQYPVWINTLTHKVPGWMKWVIPREAR